MFFLIQKKKRIKDRRDFFPRRLFQKRGLKFLPPPIGPIAQSLSPLSLSLSLSCRAPRGPETDITRRQNTQRRVHVPFAPPAAFKFSSAALLLTAASETGRFNVAGRGARFTSSAPSDAVASPTAEDEDDSEEIFSVTSDGSFIAPFLRTDLLEILCRVKADAFVADLFVAWWSARVVFEANAI